MQPYVMTIEGSIHVKGSITCGEQIVLPPGTVTDSAVAAGPVAATKTEQRQRLTYSQESATTTVSESKTIHVVHGATGTIQGFRAGSIVANIGAATITVDLKKNGTTVLTAPIPLNNTHAARQVVVGAISGGGAVVAGDVLEVTVVATAGGGTIGKGVFAEVIVDEKPV